MLVKLKARYPNSFLSFESTGKKNVPNLYIRYDLDTRNCLLNAKNVIKTQQKLGLPAAVFVRTDALDYSLEELSQVASELKLLNVPIGLHSSCYLSRESWRESLRKEIFEFERIFGDQVTILTVHGLGEVELFYRNEFSAFIATNSIFDGKKIFLDYPPARVYDFVFQDCWTSRETGERVIYSEFYSPPPLRNGGNYLVLIHPCYWAF